MMRFPSTRILARSHWLMLLTVALSPYMSSSFQSHSFGHAWTNSVKTSSASMLRHRWTSRNQQGKDISGRCQPRPNFSRLHLIMADAPIDEDEKINHHRRGNSNEESSSSANADASDWTPSPHGGFIPNLGKILERRQWTKQHPQQPEQVSVSSSKTSSNSPRVISVADLAGYKSHVVDEADRLVCVRFYAPWCRACKAVAPLFARLATQYPSVKFVEVPLTKDNAFMLQGLGVPSLPYGHIYHPQAGLVEERKMNRKVFGKLAYILSTYVKGECSLEEYETMMMMNKDVPSERDDNDTVLKP